MPASRGFKNILLDGSRDRMIVENSQGKIAVTRDVPQGSFIGLCFCCTNTPLRMVSKWLLESVGMAQVRPILCIFGNSSGVLHDRLSEMSLMATPYVK